MTMMKALAIIRPAGVKRDVRVEHRNAAVVGRGHRDLERLSGGRDLARHARDRRGQLDARAHQGRVPPPGAARVHAVEREVLVGHAVVRAERLVEAA